MRVALTKSLPSREGKNLYSSRENESNKAPNEFMAIKKDYVEPPVRRLSEPNRFSVGSDLRTASVPVRMSAVAELVTVLLLVVTREYRVASAGHHVTL